MWNLPIGLRSCDRREDVFDLEVVAQLLEFVIVELCFIIGYDGVGDSIPTYNVLVDEFLDLCRCDGRKRLCFNPFNEVVDSHYCVLYITSPFGKSAD